MEESVLKSGYIRVIYFMSPLSSLPAVIRYFERIADYVNAQEGKIQENAEGPHER